MLHILFRPLIATEYCIGKLLICQHFRLIDERFHHIGEGHRRFVIRAFPGSELTNRQTEVHL